MDGFEAAREIRRREEGRSRVPIVALTAQAGEEARQRCLSAGMDGRLTKPITLATLSETIARHRQHLPADAAGEEAAEHPVLDLAALTADLSGDEAMADSLVQALVAEAGEQVQQYETAIASGDFAMAARVAHSLKGAAATVRAAPLAAAAAAAEAAAQAEIAPHATALIVDLNRESDRLLRCAAR